MYPLRPLEAELIPLAKRTEGLGNEEVDYKLSLSLFSESVEQNTLDTKTTTSARQERHKKRDKQSLLSFQAVALVSHVFFDPRTSVLR